MIYVHRYANNLTVEAETEHQVKMMQDVEVKATNGVGNGIHKNHSSDSIPHTDSNGVHTTGDTFFDNKAFDRNECFDRDDNEHTGDDAPPREGIDIPAAKIKKPGPVRTAMANVLLTKHNPLTLKPSLGERLCYAFRCPPHDNVGQALTMFVLLLLVWGALVAITGSHALPGGNLFSLLVLFVCSVLAGKAVEVVGLPPLLGMLLVGICCSSIPGVSIIGDSLNDKSSAAIKKVALVIILMRAGIGLNPKALKSLSFVVVRLALTPCLVETATVTVVAWAFLGFPWVWGCMLGFLLSAVSPAVVVPCILQLQAGGYGTDKGIPTLVIAAASVDNVLAISGFTLMLAIAFSQGSLAFTVLKAPCEMLLGIAYGIVVGLLLWVLPDYRKCRSAWMQFGLLMSGGLVAVFGSTAVDMGGAGALGCLTICFVAGIGYRRQDAKTKALSPSVRDLANGSWDLIQPVLFSLIGTEIKVTQLDPDTILMGLVTLCLALTFRISTTFLVTIYSGLNLRERLFVAFAWLPKATVQAAFASVAASYVRELLAKTTDEAVREKLLVDQVYADKILTIAVLFILVAAPIGAIAIMKSAPRLLVKAKTDETESA